MKQFILLFLIGLLVASCGSEAISEEGHEEAEADSQMQEIVQICYRNTKESEFSSEKYPSFDSVYVYMTLNQDGTVSGKYNDLPAEIDSKRSTFTGTLEDGVITAKATTISEGMEYEENYIFAMVDKELEVKKEGDVLYSLKKVDCE